MGCGNLGQDHDVATVTLPVWEGETLPLAGWLMVSDGAEPVFLPPDTRAVELRVAKNVAAPVLFHPLTKGDAGERLRFFKPAGCIYPSSTAATWEGGLGAALCLRLRGSAESRALCGAFNWRRLQQEVASLCLADPTFNPWHMDTGAILTLIASGRFTKTPLKSAAMEVTLEVGAPAPELEEASVARFRQSYVPAESLEAAEAEGRFFVTAPYVPGSDSLLLRDDGELFLIHRDREDYALARMPGALYAYGE
jgi:hypothetical protein